MMQRSSAGLLAAYDAGGFYCEIFGGPKHAGIRTLARFANGSTN